MEERVTVKPKFENPCAIVNLQCLQAGFAQALAGCPVEGCKRPFISHSVRVDASSAKCTFICKKGHPTAWTSSEQIGRQMIVLNKLVPAAAVMSGLKIVPMKRFLGLLSVDSQNADYMKKSSLDLLAKLTSELFAEELDRTRLEMLTEPSFDAGNSLYLAIRYCFAFSLVFGFVYSPIYFLC